MKYFSSSFYYVRYRVLGKIIIQNYKQFRLWVWLISIPFLFAYFLNQIAHIFFRLLDEIFFSGFHNKEIKQPVFIIANPRSGTTYLHRLITLDEGKFAYTKNAHTFIMTASFVYIYDIFRWVDRKILFGIIRKAVNKLDEKLWGGWEDIHTMGFNKAEEDELIFAQAMMSVGVLIPFPYFDTMHETKFLDHEPAEVQKSVMDFYQNAVKRFMHGTGGNKTYLAKNVMHTGRFKSLINRFPDAKIIYIARHPYDSVPSCASMFTMMYEYLAPDITDDAPTKKAWAKLGIDLFKYSKQMRDTLPSEQFYQLKYDDLLADPKQALLDIYKHFNWQVSPSFEQALAQEGARNRNYKSTHTYTLEQFGYTKQQLYAELKDEMDELGFDKGF